MIPMIHVKFHPSVQNLTTLELIYHIRFRQQKANAGPFTRPDGTLGDWSLRTTTALMSSGARTPRSILFGVAKEDAPASAASQGQDMSCPLMKP